jgi:carbamoyltransferase
MNLKIKFRESFRPFAPIVLEEDKDEYFDLDVPSPYMLLVSDVDKSITKNVKKNSKKLDVIKKVNEERSSIPAVTHVDYSARVQTVDKRHKSFYELLKSFKKLTGCSVLVNTSFNVRGEPIVHTPKDAYNCFMLTDMDYLVLGNYVLDKKSQSEWSDELKTDYLNKFELD